MDRSSRQKVNKETSDFKNTIDQMDLTDIRRTFHPRTVEYTCSSAHEIFSRIEPRLSHKTSLNTFKETEIIVFFPPTMV